jgi:hypothetical protein
MKNQRASLRVSLGGCIVAAVAIAHPLLAQQNRPPSRPTPIERNTGNPRRERDERLMRNEDLRRREWELRSLENARRTPPESPTLRLAYAQIREDFVRLQVVNNEMMSTTFASTATRPDYRQIAKAVGEIRRRASRLKSNLPLPEPERNETRQTNQEITNDEQLKSSLLALDQLIMSFVLNPMFKTLSVIDAQDGVKARRDLEGIIALSERIKKSAERLGH